MKFKADREELKGRLQEVRYGVGSKHSILPALSCVLLKAQGDRLQLRACNMETAVEVSMSVTVEEEGACAVVFDPLLKWVGAPLPKDTVTITLTKTKTGLPLSLRVQCGRNYSTHKGVFPEDEMPVARHLSPTAVVSAVDLIEAIQAVEWAVMPEKEATKIVCTGILLEVYEDKVRLVAMDGYNAAMYDLPARRTPEWGGLGDSVVVNHCSMDAVAKLVSGDVQIGFDEGFVSFKTDDVTVVGTTLEGAYPAYGTLFAGVEEGEKIWTVSKAEFAHLIKTIEPFTRPAYGNPSFLEVELSNVRKAVTLDGQATDVGDCMGTVRATGRGAILFAVSPVFIKKAVNSIVGGELTFTLRSPDEPYLLKPSESDRHKIVMMPVVVTRPAVFEEKEEASE